MLNSPSVIFMKWSSILSDLQTGAYTTLHIVSATQPHTLVLFCTTKLSSVQRTVCVCAWSTDYEHERKQMLVRCTSAARCDFSPITGLVPDALFRPQNKTKCTDREMKPHTHIQNWAACRPAGSPASYTSVDIADWDLTCSEWKETKGFALVDGNGDLSDDCIEWRGPAAAAAADWAIVTSSV